MLGVAKRLLTKSIEELSRSTQFAIFFGGSDMARLKKFPENGKPVEASEANKKAAAAFLATAPVDGTPSIASDLVAALRSAEQLTSNSKSIIYVGKGIIQGGTPEGVLKLVAMENRKGVKISVLGIEPTQDSEEFLKKLAAENGGTYKKVE